MARRGTFSTHSHIYVLSSSEAITELLGLASSQENCIWEVTTGSKPDVSSFFFFFFKELIRHSALT